MSRLEINILPKCLSITKNKIVVNTVQTKKMSEIFLLIIFSNLVFANPPCRSEQKFEECLRKEFEKTSKIFPKESEKNMVDLFCSNLEKLIFSCEKQHLECNSDQSL